MMDCDDIAFEDLLNGDGDIDSHDPEMARHLETCTHCQTRLAGLAANAEQWEETQHWLSSRDAQDPMYAELLEARERWKRPVAWNEAMTKRLLSAARHPEMLGRIGRYDVERLIGSGGMGVVFKAYDTELNRPVAVKLLAPYLASSGAARNRFAREACAAAAVVDDHVVPIHNVETDEEHPFLVMKYIAGGSLQQRLDREGPLEICELLRIGIHTAKGLAAAHAQGLIHRDVKPANILLDEGVDRALLTDFGLARTTDDASLTRSGFHPGTPHYMSPEQIRGEAIDARSDLFGLGCVLYSLCTGHPPFRSETSYAVLRRITDDIPRPIRETNSKVPKWLEQIVMKLLAKCPDNRFDSAQQVAELLENCLAHVQQPTTTPFPNSVSILLAQQEKIVADTRKTGTRSLPARLVGWPLAIFIVLVTGFAGLAWMLDSHFTQQRREMEVIRAVNDHQFIVDQQAFSPGQGRHIFPIDHFEDVDAFISAYEHQALRIHVPVGSYGKSWKLTFSNSAEGISLSQVDGRPRSLVEAGIKPGSALNVQRLDPQ